MSFSFNFAIESDFQDEISGDSSINLCSKECHVDRRDNFSSENTIPFAVVPRPYTHTAINHKFSIISLVGSNISIIEDAMVSSEPENSDLVECVYGGGKKVWECSMDLAIFLLENRHSLGIDSSSKILELGCGHGIPGIVLLQLGFPVTFTDLNADVLEKVTWMNILQNCPNESLHATCIGGDWRNLSRELNGDSFDLIVSAETLYSPLSCHLVADFLAKHLRVGGYALLGTKRFYFGVNGGTFELARIISAKYAACLSLETLKEYVDGCSNVRDLLKVTKLAAMS